MADLTGLISTTWLTLQDPYLLHSWSSRTQSIVMSAVSFGTVGFLFGDMKSTYPGTNQQASKEGIKKGLGVEWKV